MNLLGIWFPPARRASLLAIAALCCAAAFGCAAAPAPQTLAIAYLARKVPAQPSYEMDATPADAGLEGARLAVQDNNTAAFLTGQTTQLTETILEPAQSAATAARALADRGIKVIVAALVAGDLLDVADAVKGSGTVVLNASATDDRLRGADCRADLFHVAPSRAMLGDALAQFLALKRWTRIFLVVGPHPEDKLYADAFKASAAKFNLDVLAEKPWTFGPLAKARADSPVEADALVFTREIDADIIVVADEADDFGDFVPYHTWNPRLVAGTQGLVATTWHPAQQAWGSTQLQNRFTKLAGRAMRPLDYQAWAAVRVLGEAALRTRGVDVAALAAYMAGPRFQLAAFKGVAESFRDWDHQLRQPILIAQPRAIVSVSPQPGYLHERTSLDTLGVDSPETACRFP
jgi:ABC transporter substrate binding protein (PQQ-dependent alcohol dehydrogenase system)